MRPVHLSNLHLLLVSKKKGFTGYWISRLCFPIQDEAFSPQFQPSPVSVCSESSGVSEIAPPAKKASKRTSQTTRGEAASNTTHSAHSAVINIFTLCPKNRKFCVTFWVCRNTLIRRYCGLFIDSTCMSSMSAFCVFTIKTLSLISLLSSLYPDTQQPNLRSQSRDQFSAAQRFPSSPNHWLQLCPWPTQQLPCRLRQSSSSLCRPLCCLLSNQLLLTSSQRPLQVRAHTTAHWNIASHHTVLHQTSPLDRFAYQKPRLVGCSLLKVVCDSFKFREDIILVVSDLSGELSLFFG